MITPQWPAPKNILALSTTREGGVSTGAYDSFNLAHHVGDDPAHVKKNRARLQSFLPFENTPCWLSQVHGCEVVQADKVIETTEADASVTTKRRTACVIMTADCLPILLTTKTGSGVAAIHGGWRSLAAGIIENTVRALSCPPNEILAWLGPAISQAAFEVGPEVREIFLAKNPETQKAFQPNTNARWQANLHELARLTLQNLGIHDIYADPHCTHQNPTHFFSYRRDQQTGRMATLIARL